jgi:WD40 repeat protein
VVAIVFSPDGEILAIGFDDKTIQLWHLKTEQELYALPLPSWHTGSIAISPDGQ